MPPLTAGFDAVKELIAAGAFDSGGGIKYSDVKHKTADYTIVTGTDPSGMLFTNRGASGAVVFTLPAPSLAIKGTFYDFLGHANQNITVATPTADTLVAINDAAADSLAASTTNEKIGSLMRFICDGQSWFGIGIAKAATFTVNT